MELGVTVELMLKHSPEEALCAACLAFACDVSLLEMRDVIERLVEPDDRNVEVTPRCTGCERTVPSVVYRPRAGKCAHCSQPVETGDVSTFIDGDLFHALCLRRLMSDDTMRASRALSRRSRLLIDESRRRMREGHGWTPLDPSA